MTALLQALRRYGGLLLAPRATVRALRPDEGLRDGLWLGGAYLLAMGTFELLEALVTLRATPDLGGLVMLLAAVGRTLVAPILVLVACETVLGRARAHRRGLYLVPLLLVAGLAHEAGVHGLRLPFYVAPVIGAVLAIALAWWTKGEVMPEEAT